MARLDVKHFKYIDAGKRVMHAVIPESVVNSMGFRIVRSWVFQGMLYMAYSEIFFRIFVESMLIVAVLNLVFGELTFTYLATSIFLSHTMMWLFNSHFWALSLGDGRRMTRNKPVNIIKYFDGLSRRLNKDSSVDGCVVFGSLARGKFTENSDIDILLCISAGLNNTFSAYLVGMRERLIAFLYRIPIEMYFYDIDVFERLDEGETPMLIKDSSGGIQRVVQHTIFYNEYPFCEQQFFKNNHC